MLEGIPSELGQRITEAISVPTIGIGAGPACDGQVLVCYDFLGMYPSFKPKFVKYFAELGAQIVSATQSYVKEVQDGSFPSAAQSFGALPKNNLRSRPATSRCSALRRRATAPRVRTDGAHPASHRV